MTAADLLKLAYLPFLAVHFTLLVWLLYRFRRALGAPFAGLDAKTLALPALLFLLAVYLRLGASGRYGLDDLLWEHVRNAGAALGSFRFTEFVHPAGHSFLVALSFLFGRAVENASRLTILLDALGAPLLFFILFLLTRSAGTAFFGGLILASLPWQVFISGAGLDVSTSLFFCLAALLALLVSLETGEAGTLASALALLAWSAAIRTENLLLLPFFLLAWRLRRPAAAAMPRRYWAVLALFLPALIWLLLSGAKFGASSSPDGPPGAAFISLGNMAANFRQHVFPHFLFVRHGYPLLLLPLGLLGLVETAFFLKEKKALYILLTWTLFWCVIYGGYWYGSQVYRYSVLLHPALALAAACGAGLLMRLVREAGWRAGVPGWGALCALLLFSAFPPARLARPSPAVFWPSLREFAAVSGRMDGGYCVLAQGLKYGRSDNFRRLLGKDRRVIEWPSDEALPLYGCPGIYYFDLRAYAHPLPDDLKIYDWRQEALFREYETSPAFSEGPLKVYSVGKKRGGSPRERR